MVVIALVLIGVAGLGPDSPADRLPADRGPGLRADRRAAARRRLQGAHRRGDGARSSKIAQGHARRRPACSPSAASRVLDNSASLPNAGVAYVVLKDWGERGKDKGQDLLSIYQHLNSALRGCAGRQDVRGRCRRPSRASATPTASRCRSRSGTAISTIRCCRRSPTTIVKNGNAQSALQRLNTSFRADVPQLSVDCRPRQGGDARHHGWAGLLGAPGYVGSSYVTQFNKFGRTFQVYVQADARFPRQARGHSQPQGQGRRRHDGAARHRGRRSRPCAGPSLISLYNLYPTATIVGGRGARASAPARRSS